MFAIWNLSECCTIPKREMFTNEQCECTKVSLSKKKPNQLRKYNISIAYMIKAFTIKMKTVFDFVKNIFGIMWSVIMLYILLSAESSVFSISWKFMSSQKTTFSAKSRQRFRPINIPYFGLIKMSTTWCHIVPNYASCPAISIIA